MARYIDADKLREYWLENGVNENVYNTNNVLDSIDYQSTADVVEVKEARWKGAGMGEYYCSLCNMGVRQYEGQPYCSECGAKMDGGKAE